MTCAMQPVSPATNLMIQRMLTSAVFAGFAAGLLAALLHFGFVQNLILLGEQYETGALTHFVAAETGHSYDQTNATPSETAATVDSHSHASPPSEFGRNVWTSLMFGLAYVGCALILVAGMALAEIYGQTIKPHDGLLWGIASFAVFQLAPAMGMAPELPGTLATDLGARQIWWTGTVVCTAVGLGLLRYSRGLLAIGSGIVILALPHLIGAPVLETFSGVAPPELASAFAARALGAAFVVWAAMGLLAARLWSCK